MYILKPAVGGGGNSRQFISWICATSLSLRSNPLFTIVYSVVNYRPYLTHFWAKVVFAIPTKVTFFHFYPQIFPTCTYRHSVQEFCNPQNLKKLMCHPILVTILKMHPHDSQSRGLFLESLDNVSGPKSCFTCMFAMFAFKIKVSKILKMIQ